MRKVSQTFPQNELKFQKIKKKKRNFKKEKKSTFQQNCKFEKKT